MCKASSQSSLDDKLRLSDLPTLWSKVERKCAERGTKGSSYNPFGRRIIPGNYCKVALKYAGVTEWQTFQS